MYVDAYFVRTLFDGSFIEFDCLFLVSSIFQLFLVFTFVEMLNNFGKKVAVAQLRLLWLKK